ncbi:hypothetical protein GRH90_23135 [Enterobacteriales bacterium SAP-6]|uniref:Uncharacterized protein n=1 Tax=Acerihabitans arboris TaxID=2691583 RepID=A0A845SK41_9GAMM|nr:hypothetical protein [Acerihabitans arboris]
MSRFGGTGEDSPVRGTSRHDEWKKVEADSVGAGPVIYRPGSRYIDLMRCGQFQLDIPIQVAYPIVVITMDLAFTIRQQILAGNICDFVAVGVIGDPDIRLMRAEVQAAVDNAGLRRGHYPLIRQTGLQNSGFKLFFRILGRQRGVDVIDGGGAGAAGQRENTRQTNKNWFNHFHCLYVSM